MIMSLTALYRPATTNDARQIAELYSIASDGITDYIWHTLQDENPGLSPLEIGIARTADPDNIFGYKRCTIAELSGEVVGMMVTFPINESSSENDQTDTSPTDPNAAEPQEPKQVEPDVLAPYALEKANTWYICALAVFPEYRGQGIGSEFLNIAQKQAQREGYSELSLLCFDQNVGAKRLYQRRGFTTIDRTPVVPHDLIHYTGDILLMTAQVEQ